MTTQRKYFCNICKDEINDKNPGVGFSFRSGDTEFEENYFLSLCENHMCFDCIRATWELSNRLHAAGKL